MRKFDKLYNLQKVNLLAEKRYLESKGLVSEKFGMFEMSIDNDGSVSAHNPLKNENQDEDVKRGDKIVWIAPPKEVARLVRVIPGAKGEYLGREGGEEVVSFNGYNFYTSRGTFELVGNIGNNKEMNNVSNLINHVKSQGGLQ